ncbi:unnamed protein product [Rangifer tarandus platyrhynchus]|uniref:Uncharacterized protein n=1 Tax=Rangifer tarandus platyrhynchus TaxID=3082113 RepID=A0AC59Y539_RANTA
MQLGMETGGREAISCPNGPLLLSTPFISLSLSTEKLVNHLGSATSPSLALGLDDLGRSSLMVTPLGSPGLVCTACGTDKLCSKGQHSTFDSPALRLPGRGIQLPEGALPKPGLHAAQAGFYLALTLGLAKPLGAPHRLS